MNKPTRRLVDELLRPIIQSGIGIWTLVYHCLDEEIKRGIVIAALVPESKVDGTLQSEDWKFDPRDLRPGCVKYGDGRIVYYTHGSEDGCEPLVLEREFGGIKPASRELSEEFRLLHNLYYDDANGKYIKVMTDGNEQEVVRITENEISVHTTEIKQFLGVKEMALVLLFDICCIFPQSLQILGCTEESKLIRAEDLRCRYTIHDLEIDKGSFVRILGKKIVRGFPKGRCGIWPFTEGEEAQVIFPEFITGVDEEGRHMLAPCNPETGRYLTPVYFQPEVLNRYYDNPTKYSVEDGYLRCGTLWSLQIHNDRPDYVTVFLGDLGRDLPSSERPYWRSFNIPPAGPMSEVAFRRSILAEFADPTKPDLVFKQKYLDFQISWEKKHGWRLFKPLRGEDAHCFSSLRIPATGEQVEFDAQVMHLTKLLVDCLNEARIAKDVSCPPDAKGISKLARYAEENGMPDRERHIELLGDLQALRSAGVAHRKGKNYDKIAKKLGLDRKDRRRVYTELLIGAVALLDALQSI